MTSEVRHIGHYRDAVLIGRGGFASVYSADDPEHGRKVAIKVLDAQLGETERRRFDRERQLMGQLGSHMNIISVFDSGYTDRDEAYIVMEFASGGTLRDLIDRSGPVPWSEAVALVTKVAVATGVAHDRGIVHRDIKPDNILVDEYGEPRLTDFGIAVVTSSGTSTQLGSATLAHAAPEVLEGKAGTEATDVYALASTLHTLVTGVPPFTNPDEEGLGALMRRIISDPPPDLRPFGVPGPVADVVERAMVKDPAQRPQHAGVFASALQVAAAGAPVARAAQTIDFAPVAPPEPDPSATSVVANLGAVGVPPTEGTPAVSPAAGSSGPPVAASPAESEAPPEPPPTARPDRGGGGGRRWLLGGAALLAVIAVLAFALLRDDQDEPELDASASTTSSIAPTTTTTSTTSTSSTTSTTSAPPVGSISIDCPTVIPLGEQVICPIVTDGVSTGEWELPGFLDGAIPIEDLNGSNDIAIQPVVPGAADASYVITARATTTDGRTIEASHTFRIPLPEVVVECPDEIAAGSTAFCEITSNYATSGTWEIPGFGDDVLEFVPGLSSVFVSPNSSVIGQEFTATAVVTDDFDLETTASDTFTVVAG